MTRAPILNFGIDSYGLRFQGWSADDLLSYCCHNAIGIVSIDLQVFQLTSKEAVAVGLRAADEAIAVRASGPPLVRSVGASLEATPSQEFERALRICNDLGARSLRTFAVPVGQRPSRRWDPKELAGLREILQRLVFAAASLNITVAVENHQDLRAEEILSLIEGIHPQCVVCFDFGNQFHVTESPFEAFTLLGPYTTYCHVKDLAFRTGPSGLYVRAVPLGMGGLPIRALLDVGLSHGINDFMLEISTSRAPSLVPVVQPSVTQPPSQRAFWSFVKQYERWPREVDAYLSREKASTSEIAAQELEHIRWSLKWWRSELATVVTQRSKQ
ncbi:MAG: sugar phosphate isomerase/epimerase [Acidobacteria bacterium]|nr:sugar phosphate isomerase/epimerase [Acidobacteriota bacterium]